MKEINLITLSSLVVIFVSVFFMHVTLNNFFFMNDLCSSNTGPACTESSIFMLLIFTFLIVLSFIIVIESTIYYIFREVEMRLFAQAGESKKDVRSIKAAMTRKQELLKAKEDARKKYYSRKIGEKTYNELRDKYDKEILETENEINKARKKLLK